jgi:hypothetical protein
MARLAERLGPSSRSEEWALSRDLPLFADLSAGFFGEWDEEGDFLRKLIVGD